jgi:hypothetical protein
MWFLIQLDLVSSTGGEVHYSSKDWICLQRKIIH